MLEANIDFNASIITPSIYSGA